MKKPTWHIGIDPGTHTGVALWNSDTRKITYTETCTVFEALKFVESAILACAERKGVRVVFEDARKRKAFKKDAFGENDVSVLQGAGSIKRDSAIWQEACEHWAKRFKIGFSWRGVAPNGKTNALAKNKGLAERNLGVTNTSEHARCAAFLVWNS